MDATKARLRRELGSAQFEQAHNLVKDLVEEHDSKEDSTQEDLDQNLGYLLYEIIGEDRTDITAQLKRLVDLEDSLNCLHGGYF